MIHGSHRAEHEAHQKLAVVRERIEKTLADLMQGGRSRTTTATTWSRWATCGSWSRRAWRPPDPRWCASSRSPTSACPVTPELGLFLARLNFGLMFGRFALDAEHQSIWFDETLLGDQFRDEELRFTIQVVASTADQWDDRLKQMFGGATFQETLTGRAAHTTPPTKPGQGGYL